MALAALVVVISCLGIWLIANRSTADDARWRLEESFIPKASSTEIPVRVSEAACASGTPATGRMEIKVSYSPSAVTIDIKVEPLKGDQSCVGVETPYTVKLREPLGERELVDANARTPDL